MEPLPKIKCKFCKYLAITFNALREHCKGKHSAEYVKITSALRQVDDQLRQLTETDIIE